MSKAIVVNTPGDASTMQWQDYDPGGPGRLQVLIKHDVIGVNFLDVYHRTGLYPWPEADRLIPGAEGCGTVLTLGQDVTGLEVGDRVAYCVKTGAYSEYRVIAADRLVKLPDALDNKIVAACMLKGLTVEYLFHRTFALGSNHTILFHAAAGGVGLLAGLWAKHLGVTIIGTTSTDEKVEIARQNGYSHVINYHTQDIRNEVMEITDGKGVDVVYDSVGNFTWQASLDCLKRRGLWVSFGQSSGPVAGFDLGLLAKNGSLFATRPSLFDYIAEPQELQASAAKLFAMLERGHLRVSIHREYALADAATAHIALEGRKTSGSSILIPNVA
ncbi:MAG: quinone oxidoreductase [Pseudomonadota bacterium]